jgi:peptide/nickel transport system substrate-binding protein
LQFTELEITINSYGDEKGGPVIQANLLDIGIDAKVNNMDRGAFLDLNNSGNFQCSLNGWTTSPDPDRFFASLIHSAGVGTNNVARYANPEMDALVRKGSSTIDEAEREVIYNQVHELAMEDAIWVPLYSKVLVMGGSADYTYDGVLDPMWNVNFNLVRKK